MRYFWNAERGQDLVEYAILLALVTVAAGWLLFFGLPFTWSKLTHSKPNPTQTTTEAKAAQPKASQSVNPESPQAGETSPALVIALFASLLASIAWNTKQAIFSLTNLTQLRLLEVLSSRPTGVSRAELVAAAQEGHRLLLLMPTSDALSQLVIKGLVGIKNGLYFMKDLTGPSPKAVNETDEGTESSDPSVGA